MQTHSLRQFGRAGSHAIPAWFTWRLVARKIATNRRQASTGLG